jgi:hypothetical protein
MKSAKRSKTPPDVVMWRGIGILSPTGIILDGWAKNGDHILNRLECSPRGSRLVHIVARLEHMTKRQVAEERDDGLGIVSPEAPFSRKISKAAVVRVYAPLYKVFEITPEGEEVDLSTTIEAADDDLIPVLKKWDLLDKGLPLSCILADFDKGTCTISTKVSPRKTSKFIPCLRLVGPWRELGE